MAVLEYTIVQDDITRWSTLSSIKQYTSAEGTKQLAAVLDPLTDPTIINPQEAYSVS